MRKFLVSIFCVFLTLNGYGNKKMPIEKDESSVCQKSECNLKLESIKEGKMKYELVPLEYAYNALEPVIDARTVEIHHDKHQATYVANLNAALEKEPDFKTNEPLTKLLGDLNKVPESIRVAVRNNGGGVWNHTFYWRNLSPDKSQPSPELMKAIIESFGSFDDFKKQMTSAAIGRFGSGWAWLGVGENDKLEICSTPNQDTPIMGKIIAGSGIIPILTIDVWEHAYYLKYQNKRAEYAEKIWDIINWQRVSERYIYALAHRTPLL